MKTVIYWCNNPIVYITINNGWLKPYLFPHQKYNVEKGTIWLLKIVFLDKCKFTLRGSKVHLGFSYAFLDEKWCVGVFWQSLWCLAIAPLPYGVVLCKLTLWLSQYCLVVGDRVSRCVLTMQAKSLLNTPKGLKHVFRWFVKVDLPWNSTPPTIQKFF